MNEQEKYSTIKKLVETNGNKKRAAVKLNCTIRHINRLIKAYKEKGKESFSHGNKGRISPIALSENIRNKIVELYKSKYSDANITHFTELLAINENIIVSVPTVRTLLLNNNILSPKSHKKGTKKNYELIKLTQKILIV